MIKALLKYDLETKVSHGKTTWFFFMHILSSLLCFLQRNIRGKQHLSALNSLYLGFTLDKHMTLGVFTSSLCKSLRPRYDELGTLLGPLGCSRRVGLDGVG